mmetsp:Transcript_54460/g.80845  ORF Transcript_54460/g.80845 Transcript_54460/m.80845 type:complete len:167 (+) Transcript_54460:103-603(+)
MRPSNGESIPVSKSSVISAWNYVFDPTNNNLESVTYMVLQSLKSCPMDLRKIMASHVLLVGGGAFLPGFEARLTSEVQYAVTSLSEFKCLKACVLGSTTSINNDGGFQLIDLPFDKSLRNWMGASIMGTLELSEERWLHQKVWMEHEKERKGGSEIVFDWLNTAKR